MAYDFSGYATKNDIRCSDGRVIRSGAFQDCDGKTVPLVWNHLHTEMENVLGHARLENRNDGVYAYCTLNDTEAGRQARALVKNGDLTALSIYANELQQQGANVVHGNIREVSVVLSGANPGAMIDNLSFEHDGMFDPIDDEAIIYSGLEHSVSLAHQAGGAVAERIPVEEREEEGAPEPTVQDILDTLTEDQMDAVYALIGATVQDLEDGEAEDYADDEDYDEEIEQSGISDGESDSMAQSDSEEGVALMNQNVFDNDAEAIQHDGVMTKTEMESIFADARRIGSLKEAVIEHGFEDLTVSEPSVSMQDRALAHGVETIDMLFPDFKNIPSSPAVLARPMEWVSGVLGGISKSPFNRIRSMAFDITAEEARARGYIKGKKKVEEQIKALKRTTTPQTVYKLQKLDRDDVIDITDFDIVAFLKSEMRMMLDEELARAILVGDGRTAIDESKIKEDNIRPVWGDDEVYTINHRYDTKPSSKEELEQFIDDIIRSRKDYRGSGNPTLFIGTDLLTEMRLIRDADGYRRYKNDTELAQDLRVSKIVDVQLLDGLKREVSGKQREFGALIVNLRDYTMGATRGGQVTLFDDFDLNYNKMEYLIETRCCGALTQPKSALAFEFGEAED